MIRGFGHALLQTQEKMVIKKMKFRPGRVPRDILKKIQAEWLFFHLDIFDKVIETKAHRSAFERDMYLSSYFKMCFYVIYNFTIYAQ